MADGKPVQPGTGLLLGPGKPSPEFMAYTSNSHPLTKSGVLCEQESWRGVGKEGRGLSGPCE